MSALKFLQPLPPKYDDQLWEIYQSLLLDQQSPLGGSWKRAQLESEMGEGRVVGALTPDTLILKGFLIYSQHQTDCDILLLGVDPSWKRRGTMTQLIDFFVANSGATRFFVEVHEKNAPAQAFYKSYGFRQVGYRRDFYGQGESAYLLALDT